MSLGLAQDLDYCLTQDITDVIPVFRDGRIVLQ